MDLETVFQNAGSMDAQNITLLLLNLVAQIGNSKKIKRPASNSTANGYHKTNRTNDTEVDPDVLLAHNISAMLMKYYKYDPAFWAVVVGNLEEEEIRKKKEKNQRLSPTTSTVLISVYMMVIGIGTFGNLLVITAVARQPALRSRRNAFIINLAISDLLLCLMTMPLTLVELINGHWPLGDSEWSCKASGGFQAVSVFVSTISITVIALDRYQLIVYPTRDFLQKIGVAAGIFFIWVLGFFLASPIFIFRTLERYELDDHHKRKGSRSERDIHSIHYCYEKWPVTYGQAIYSACTLLVQYAVPILVISVLHTQICQRLQIRHSTMGSMMSSQNTQRQIEEEKRLRRRHRLLMAISIIFLVCWLPLNVLNLLLDLYNPFTLPRDKEMMHIIYAICHLFGMSSACANPFLYGWFNENFRGEFKLIFTAPSRLCAAVATARQRPHSSSIQMTLNSNIISSLERGKRLKEIVHSQPMIDIANKSKNNTFDELGPTNMLTVKEVSLNIGNDRHEITVEESMSPSPLRDTIVPEGDTTNAMLHSNFPTHQVKTHDDRLPSVIVSILQSSTMETYL